MANTYDISLVPLRCQATKIPKNLSSKSQKILHKTSQKSQENSVEILEKTLAVLKKTYKLVQEGEYGYICNAVNRAGKDDDIDYEIANKIEAYIHRTLDGDTYGTWLDKNHQKFYDKYYYGNLSEGKLLWIKYMIQQVKSGNFVFLKEYKP